ncbi:TetR/AcrR family transcriptional regulator [Phenylobacterium immobile]|uniref:TetR/AcrR family transcriptional regulator n=1 Tax=Phenylobacterium immobile TaxID=21 RepID=UPI000B28384D|nr:TetR/AcrR family transcriptional regulator [Phenylobacterium immobile]
MTEPAELERSSDPQPPPVRPNGRQNQKAATRGRVLDAARELFEAEGYHGATIREIARRAGVSVGTVFTTFTSKGDILSEVMEARLDALYAEVDRVAPHLKGSTVDRLRSLFALYFAFELHRVRLFMTHISAAYDWTLPRTAKPYGRNKRVLNMVNECLLDGIRRGDVDPACDTWATTDLLIAAYAWCYRWAASEAADAESLSIQMDRHIAVVAAGFTREAQSTHHASST